MPEIRLVPLLRTLMVILFAFPLANLGGSNGLDMSDAAILDSCSEIIAGDLVGHSDLPHDQDNLFADCEVSVAAMAAAGTSTR